MLWYLCWRVGMLMSTDSEYLWALKRCQKRLTVSQTSFCACCNISDNKINWRIERPATHSLINSVVDLMSQLSFLVPTFLLIRWFLVYPSASTTRLLQLSMTTRKRHTLTAYVTTSFCSKSQLYLPPGYFLFNDLTKSDKDADTV